MIASIAPVFTCLLVFPPLFIYLLQPQRQLASPAAVGRPLWPSTRMARHTGPQTQQLERAPAVGPGPPAVVDRHGRDARGAKSRYRNDHHVVLVIPAAAVRGGGRTACIIGRWYELLIHVRRCTRHHRLCATALVYDMSLSIRSHATTKMHTARLF